MNNEFLTPSIKANAARLMVVASDINHPDWMTAIHGICDIEKSLPREALNEFHLFLSNYGGNQ